MEIRLKSPSLGNVMPKRKVLVRNLEGLLFASPWIVGLLGFFLGPMLASLFLSFTNYDVVTPPQWVGFRKYRELIHDPLIPHSLKITTIYAVVTVPLSLFLGLGLAILLNQQVRGLALWRTIFYVPTVISGIVVALLWEWMFEPRYGVINYLLRTLFHIQGPNWLADPRWALPSFFLLSLWGVGSSMLVNLAGLQGIPTSLYESAEIDGANAWQKFWNVTIPMMSPVIFYNLITGIIGALQSFTYFYQMTEGGPNNATLAYMLYLYRQAFQYMRMGYGSAMAWVLFIYVGLLTLIIFKTSSEWVYYESTGR